MSKTIQHHYGENIILLDNPFLSTILANLCSPETEQPQINLFIETLYSHLIEYVIAQEFPTEAFTARTRMTQEHPDQELKGQRIIRDQKAVVVSLARAGIFPSHICYHQLHLVLKPSGVRQDHIFASRMTAEDHSVTGTAFGSTKIGGDIDNAIVMIPDPMGATGNTILSSIDYYKNKIEGSALKYIALHLIVTPEYLRKVTQAHPEAKIYALRVDRAFSSERALNSAPGLYWGEEKGLNSKDYIVPGGGGFGEILNNSYV